MSNLPAEKHVATGCEWKQDEDGNWETGCNRIFTFTDGTPTENEFKFCCFCGLCLDQLPYDDEHFDQEELACKDCDQPLEAHVGPGLPCPPDDVSDG